jgi:hypothetical protein
MLPASAHPQLWAIKDQSTGQPMLACGSCLDRRHCGGLQVAAGGADAMACMGMCRCEDPAKCDVVCPNAPNRFVQRINEVKGFDLAVIPVAKPAPLPNLPSVAVLVEGNATRSRPTKALAHAAVPLSMTLKEAGQLTRAKTRRELEETFGVAPRQGWIASGVEKDSCVERLWRLHSPKRIYEGLKRAGVILATTPNFSTIADVPRHDNLHAMMRIGWAWYEMMEAGLPTALHLNGRTDFDFVRWAGFAKRQPALQAVAFEFLTGAEPKEDGQRYVERLKRFVEESGRGDLLLVLRGGAIWVPQLKPYFRQILQLDSGPYLKTVMRQRLVVEPDGRPRYRQNKTATNAEVRALFLHNVEAKMSLYGRASVPQGPVQALLQFDEVQVMRSTALPDERSELQYLLDI